MGAAVRKLKRSAFVQEVARLLSDGQPFSVEGAPDDLKAPYLVLSNHISNRDMFYVQAAFRDPLVFVLSTDLLCHGTASAALEKIVPLIPAFKGGIGAGTSRQILKQLKAGNAVAMFPEGRHSPDGRTGEMKSAVASLARIVGCPLVTVRIDGYFRKPRWAKQGRKGPVSAQVCQVYSPEMLASMPDEKILEAIVRDLKQDAYEKQRLIPISYSGENLAEGFETAYFWCPNCGGFGCLSSEGDEIRCASCGALGTIDPNGFLSGDFPYTELPSWWDDQKEAFRQVCADADDEEILIRYPDITLQELDLKGHRILPLETGELTATKEELRLGEHVWRWEDHPPVSVRAGSILLLEDGKHQYEFVMQGRDGERLLFLSKWAQKERNRKK